MSSAEIDRLPFLSEEVGHLPLQKPVLVKPQTTIADAVTLMQNRNRGCVIVLDSSDRLVGIFTETDMMETFIGTTLPGKTPIMDVMTKDVVGVSPETTVAQAMDVFGELHCRHLPVVGPEGLEGVLSVRVLLDFIAEHLPNEVLNLPPNPDKVPGETFGA